MRCATRVRVAAFMSGRPGRSVPSVGLPLLGLTVLALACLSGCGGDYLYYQTRYIPTSSEQSFSPSARWFRTEDREVYELPANPPALASVEGQDDHRARVDCKPPGPTFKPQPLASYGPEQRRGRGEVDSPDMAQMAGPSGIPPAPKRREPGPQGGWQNERLYGPNESRRLTDVAQMDAGPHVPRNTDTSISSDKMATTGPDDSWCPPAR